MSFLLSLLGSRTAWLAIAFAAVAGWGGVQTWRLGNAQDKLVAAKQQIVSLEQQRDMAVAAGKRCSESVQALKTAADKRTQAAQAALAKAREGMMGMQAQIAQRDAILGAARGQAQGACPAGSALERIRGVKNSQGGVK